MYKGITILSVLMGTSLLGCGFEQAGPEGSGQDADTSEESVGSVSAALNVQPNDVEPAAAVLRGVRSTIRGIPTVRNDLYVFICDNHQLKVRTKGLFGWNVGGWQAIAPDYPCDSAPTVGIMQNTESNKQDILGVYWRSDERLMEAWYNKDGTMGVTNLLDFDPAHVPAITGSPLVSDTSDPAKIQIVVRRAANDQVWTIAWTGSSYASLPVKRTNGSIVTTTARFFHTAYNAGYGREYITVEDGFDQVVFTRPPASWNTPYTQWAVAPSVNGILSIGGKSLLNHGACQTGLAIRVGGVNMNEASCLDAGGTLTSWELVGNGGSSYTIYGAPNASSNWLFGYGWNKIWLYTADPLLEQGPVPWDGSNTLSAIMQVKGGAGGYAFWAKSVNGTAHLMMADYSTVAHPNDATVTDLGGRPYFW